MVPNDESPEKCLEQEKASSRPASNEAEKRSRSVKGPGWEMQDLNCPPAPTMDFTTFCLSLASSVLIHLGQTPSPDTGQTEKNLPLAKQSIDILVLLEEKTKNNLTSEESKLLDTLLYDLRIRFCEVQKSS
jgi:hypothetical protein